MTTHQKQALNNLVLLFVKSQNEWVTGRTLRSKLRGIANTLETQKALAASLAPDHAEHNEANPNEDLFRPNLAGLLSCYLPAEVIICLTLKFFSEKADLDPEFRSFTWDELKRSFAKNLADPEDADDYPLLTVQRVFEVAGLASRWYGTNWGVPDRIEELCGLKSVEDLLLWRAKRDPGPAPKPEASTSGQTVVKPSKTPKTFDTLSATYTFTQQVGEGGSGRVFEVTDETGGRFALKLLRPDRVTTEKTRRFRNELAFCSTTHHARIVRVVDSGFTTEDGRKCPFYVMTMYPHTLRHYINQGIDHNAAVEIISNLLDGLEAAHLLNVWHRDLKPENVLCGKDPRDLVIADFGIAHFSEEYLETSVETREGAWLGNIGYAAPEQRQKGSMVDHRADLYAVGLLINQIFTGKLAHGKNHARIIDTAPEYGYLDEIVDSLLQQDPDKRLPTINAIKGELIGRRNAFVVRQRLDELRRQVIPANQVPEFEEIQPTQLAYTAGRLAITFNRAPPPEWIELFRAPPEKHTFIEDAQPARFHFDGAIASIHIPSSFTQQVVDNAKERASIANRAYATRLKEQAKAHVAKDKAEQEARVRKAEEDARVTAALRL